ncbi:hypothetical protein ACWCQK_38165 [Streptomyces sp. NPDC002306]
MPEYAARESAAAETPVPALLSDRRRRARRWTPVVIAATVVLAAGAIAAFHPLPHTTRPTTAGSARVLPTDQAQRELTSCVEAISTGDIEASGFPRPPKLTDPVRSYRPAIAVSGLRHTTDREASTWIVGTSPHKQLVACFIPNPDARLSSGRQAWPSPADKYQPARPVTAEYSHGTMFPAGESDTHAVYGEVQIGRYTADVARVTIQYPGQKEHDARTTAGVWFTHTELVQAEPDIPESWPAPQAVVRGYNTQGKVVYDSSKHQK